MTSIPKFIRVGALVFQIELKQDLSKNTDEEGAYYEDQKLIVLDKGLIEIGDRYSCILAWHEIQHAIFNQYSLVDANEEKIIHAFSQGVVQVLGDNPKFLQWMLGCLKL